MYAALLVGQLRSTEQQREKDRERERGGVARAGTGSRKHAAIGVASSRPESGEGRAKPGEGRTEHGGERTEPGGELETTTEGPHTGISSMGSKEAMRGETLLVLGLPCTKIPPSGTRPGQSERLPGTQEESKLSGG